MGAFIIFYKKIPFKCMATFSAKGSSITGRSNIRIYLSKLNDFTKRYPLSRGMIAYSVTWPVSNLCQQSIRGNKEWDFAEALRFCLYGSCFVAPTLHGWLRLAANMWPQLNFRSAIAKVSRTFLGLCVYLISFWGIIHMYTHTLFKSFNNTKLWAYFGVVSYILQRP
jgi:hypothetical protein